MRISQALRPAPILEIAAVIFTVWCVWLTAAEDILCWPIGIVGCILYVFVFFRARLYSDVLLQFYFLLTSIYGWYNWAYGGRDETALGIRTLSAAEILVWTIVIAAGSWSLGFAMKRRTKAAVPYWDATTTVMSLVAQYLLTCKVLESWILWIIADIIDSGIYLSRRLVLTGLLYALLLVLAIQGLLGWLKSAEVAWSLGSFSLLP